MAARVVIGDISVDVVLKDIRNIHLSVHPPAGRVHLSAPVGMDIDTLRLYAISRLGWIKKQQCEYSGESVPLIPGESVPDASQEKKQSLLDAWYRKQLKAAIPDLIALWEKRIGVRVNEFGIKKMKTKWGTCNPDARRIWVNLKLAKKPKECLEYIVVHEMVHLLEHHHNEQFMALMDDILPKWRSLRDDLNRLPVKHEKWEY